MDTDILARPQILEILNFQEFGKLDQPVQLFEKGDRVKLL